MSSEIRDLINQLIEAGVDPAEAAEVVARAIIVGSANSPKARSAGAIRQERYRRNKASQTVTGDVGDGLSSPEGSSPRPLSPNPLQSIPPSPPKGGSSPTTKSELGAVLDADRADAVIQHRQKLRKPLTVHAAKLLAGKFRQWPDPNAAADAMVANGWQGFEIEWMESRSTARHQPQGPPGRSKSLVEVIDERQERRNANIFDSLRTIDHEPDRGNGSPPVVRFPSDASRRGR